MINTNLKSKLLQAGFKTIQEPKNKKASIDSNTLMKVSKMQANELNKLAGNIWFDINSPKGEEAIAYYTNEFPNGIKCLEYTFVTEDILMPNEEGDLANSKKVQNEALELQKKLIASGYVGIEDLGIDYDEELGDVRIYKLYHRDWLMKTIKIDGSEIRPFHLIKKEIKLLDSVEGRSIIIDFSAKKEISTLKFESENCNSFYSNI